MAIYAFYIFDRRFCLYRHVWNSGGRNLKGREASRREELLHGLVFSLKRFCTKVSQPFQGTEAGGMGTQIPFETLTTPSYKLHYFESLSGFKFVILTGPKTKSLKMNLKEIYESLFVPLIVMTPQFGQKCREAEMERNRLVTLIQTSQFPLSLQNFIDQLTV